MFFVTITISFSFAQSQLSFLDGTWKIDGKESFEIWVLQKDGNLKGSSFKIIEGKEKLLETLTITKEENDVIYTATVLNQNDGESIGFTLNTLNDSTFSFENPHHDFPKKIIYQIKDPTELFIQVLGENDKGFSFTMFKQFSVNTHE